MKRLIQLFAFTLLLVSCSDDDNNGPQIVGSGNIVSEERTIDAFTNIQIESVIDARITFGTSRELTVSADDNIIDLVETEVINGTLILSLPNGSYDDINVEVSIVNPDLEVLSATGVNTIEVDGYEGLSRLDVNIAGVGNVTASGSSEDLRINSSGSTNFSGFNFVADTCTVDLSGVGNIEITVNDLLSGSLSGVGNIAYKGSPEVEVSVSGVGNVSQVN